MDPALRENSQTDRAPGPGLIRRRSIEAREDLAVRRLYFLSPITAAGVAALDAAAAFD